MQESDARGHKRVPTRRSKGEQEASGKGSVNRLGASFAQEVRVTTIDKFCFCGPPEEPKEREEPKSNERRSGGLLERNESAVYFERLSCLAERLFVVMVLVGSKRRQHSGHMCNIQQESKLKTKTNA